ncbi:hypothetical protein CCACVL1_18481 [Corchorus capsularis]|uniref:Uncharacterized protein n=1 Tax=Corchorus capsularis TaxID=210143 RepID=A0A1R3HL98_COCAP|nr:hypothetical protein CCACVL1_18481 [Corchorus capsularis]
MVQMWTCTNCLEKSAENKWDDVVFALKEHLPTALLSLSISFVPVSTMLRNAYASVLRGFEEVYFPLEVVEKVLALEAQRPVVAQVLQESWNNMNLINPGEVAAQPEG